MKNILFRTFTSLRRNFLTFVTPEFFWPKYVNIDGVEIKIRNEPYTFGIKYSLIKQKYEGPERNLIRNRDFYGESVIELGGSIGVLTAILSKKVGSKGMVISVEASERISAYSRIWLEKNQNTKVITGFGFPVLKVNDSIKVIKFDESGNSMQGNVIYMHSDESNYDKQFIYDLHKISDLFNIKTTILVADIEGSERIIVDQKPDFPSTLKFLLIELHPEIYGKSDRDKIIQRIIEERFRITANEGNVFAFEKSEIIV